ncbi:neutral amino acid permease [Colletotrichum kahawae]|uniref:Neutral amino acid permease n=1 Tax=Colletotrichum kahawae TaxID=34407 RepID=A0AAE0D4Z9_COLKA|nr:neutral amino acid permease [Colletotrichum kahawae]
MWGSGFLKEDRIANWPASKQEKIAVGRLLAKILYSDAVIDAYARDGPSSIGTGFRSTLFHEWLSDLEPDDLETREEKEWFRTWKYGVGSCWGYVSNRLARRWLKMGNEGWSAASMFIDGDSVEKKYSWLCNNFADDGHETLQRVTKLMIELMIEVWEERNLLNIGRDWIITECDKVLNISDKTWWALFFAAKSLAESIDRWDTDMNEIRKAHDHLEVAMSLELFKDEDYTNRYWREMLPLFARCQIRLGDLPGGKTTYTYMMESPKSWDVLKLRLFILSEPPMIMELLKAAQSVLVMEPSGHSLCHQMMSGDLEEEDMIPLRLVAHADCNWHSIVGLIEHYTLAGTSSQMLWSTMADILWHESGDTQREDQALEIWKQGKDKKAIVNALLRRAISEVPHNPLESCSFQRLKRMHPEISDPTEDPDISFRAKVMVAGWQHQSGQVTEAREFVSTLLGHRHDVYSLIDRIYRRSSLLEDWGIACIAFGNEDLGALLLEQMLLSGRSVPRSYHQGCVQICARQTDDVGQSNGMPILLCCKTCLAVIRPKCCATIEKGARLPNLCGPGHQYLPIRELHVSSEGKETNYGVELDRYLDDIYDIYEWNIWAREDDGINKAQELYGWAKPVYEDPMPYSH